MFVDYARIHLKAGRGGDGAVSFRREKYVPAGGPDGGDGGRGGNIVIKVDDGLTTLMDFRYKRKYAAQNGANGSGGRRFGKDGQSLTLLVPRGTVIRDSATELIIADMSDKEEYVIARGGRGGWGNSRFATPTRQAPRFAKSGLSGDELEVILELKMLADVGLIGFPNVGKSTLLSVISSARPKIAPYHFTTLSPNLGIVYVDEGASFVAADIPGLIEGASEGAGLGTKFLRHVDRCRLLIHIVDVAQIEGRDVVEDYEMVNNELFLYSEKLASRPQIVAANKSDVMENREGLDRLKAHLAESGIEIFEISAATGAGVQALIKATTQQLALLPPIEVFEAEYEGIQAQTDFQVEITKTVKGIFIVEGKKLFDAIALVDPTDFESLNYLHKVLQLNGVFEKLEDAGIKEGDTVSINNFEFEYVK